MRASDNKMSYTIFVTSFLIFATIEGCSVPGPEHLIKSSGNIAFNRQRPYMLEKCTWAFPGLISSDYSVLVMAYNQIYIPNTWTRTGVACSGEIWLNDEEGDSVAYMYEKKKCGNFENVCHVYWKKSSKCNQVDIIARVMETYPGCSLWWSTADSQIEQLQYTSRYAARMNFSISYNILNCELQTTKASATTASTTASNQSAAQETTHGSTTSREVNQSETSQGQGVTSPSSNQATLEGKTSQNTIEVKKHNRLKASHRYLAVVVTVLSCLLFIASLILVWMYCRQRKVTEEKPSDPISASFVFSSTIDTGSFRLNPAYEETNPDSAEVVENVLYENFVPQHAKREDTYAVVVKSK